MSPGVRDEYTRRIEARRNAVGSLDVRDRGLAFARLAVAAGGVATVVAAWRGGLGWGWSVFPAAAFLALVLAHDRVLRARARADRAVRFYEAGLARIEDRWHGRAVAAPVDPDEHHPYAADLDLFGRGSLFALLDTTRTRAGASTLAAWLLRPAERDEILARQAAVEDLRDRLDFREDLAVLGDEVRAEIDPDATRRWCEVEAPTFPSMARVAAPLMALATVSALVGWGTGATGPLPFLAAAAVQTAFAAIVRRRVMRVVAGVDRPEHDLELLASVLARVESETFRSSLLVRTTDEMTSAGLSPSAAVRKLARLTDLLNARRNQMFVPLGWLLLWTTQVALAIDSWRRTHGPHVAGWLEAVGTIEALSALGGYAFEHPDDPFPEIAEAGPIVDGVGLGHPLLPEAHCVRNAVHLDATLCLLLVSGSNMSGKSTLLRTVGVNVVLALAGSPVRAERLRISPVSLGATIRIQDSLRDGASRFWTEINRLKTILDMTAGRRPVLFLLDELFGGTNSNDRSAGAEALLRSLVARGAVGLVTTHDLALARMADSLAPRALNVHFEDRLEDGRMVFDYRLRPGVVTRSNALALMRAVGLEV